MASWITVDDNLKNGLKVLDQVDNSKLRLLIHKMCQSFKKGVTENIFKAKEEELLLISLKLEKPDLDILLNVITLILKQAVFNVVKTAVLESTMKEHFSIGDDKIAILSHSWITHGEEIFNAFKQKSMFPSQLKDVSWTVDVRAASTATSKEAKPVAKVQLNLEGSEKSKPTVEMNKHELQDLHSTMNDIYAQLLAFSKEK